ncbi:MAG: homoserine O-acetyltransferase [Elusimicrobiota bacterium]|nr:homoserine O-acetyltransferase [Elusimicrobiota bacterium]
MNKKDIFRFDCLHLKSGKTLENIEIAYEVYGEPNADKSNGILLAHAFSGNAHAAKLTENDTAGWWDNMIGPDKAFDTKKYFVICSNVLGGCGGSSGPSSINPKTGKEYALDFPFITIEDMVEAQKKLIDHLGIKKLLCVAGGSMGGMQVLEWIRSHPNDIASAIPISTAAKHSPQQIAFNEVGRQAIMSDIDWNNGNYYQGNEPKTGLSLARMIGHITYMSDKSMETKFSRKLKDNKDVFTFNVGANPEFEVEGYLQYKGDAFVKRFDANSYLYMTKALDYFDVSGKNFTIKTKNKSLKFLVIAFKSDRLYPSYQTEKIARLLKLQGFDATYCEIKSTYGHDSFLLETEDETKLIKSFLRSVEKGGER